MRSAVILRSEVAPLLTTAIRRWLPAIPARPSLQVRLSPACSSQSRCDLSAGELVAHRSLYGHQMIIMHERMLRSIILGPFPSQETNSQFQ